MDLEASVTFISTVVDPRLTLSTSRCCCLLNDSHIQLWTLHGSCMNHFKAQDCSTNKYSSSCAACVSKVIYRGKIRTGNFCLKYPKRKCCQGNEAGQTKQEREKLHQLAPTVNSFACGLRNLLLREGCWRTLKRRFWSLTNSSFSDRVHFYIAVRE